MSTFFLSHVLIAYPRNQIASAAELYSYEYCKEKHHERLMKILYFDCTAAERGSYDNYGFQTIWMFHRPKYSCHFTDKIGLREKGAPLLLPHE